MRTLRLPDRSFKVKFKIFRYGFTDFDVFARRLTETANWKIQTLRETSHTYDFENGWSITLHPHGDISLYSPLLKPEEAVEVYGAIDALVTMDVRVGENCEVEMHYEGKIGKDNGLPIFSGLPLAFLSATALILFLATKTAQLLYLKFLTRPILIFFEVASFAFLVTFAYVLFKITNRKEPFETVLLQASKDRAHEDFMRNEDIRRRLTSQFSIRAMDLVKEISFPLENIMAYTRFYSSHTQEGTQHWRDLMEIMEQAIRVRTAMNRVESQFRSDVELAEEGQETNRKLFRKSHRRMDLIFLNIRGTDLLGERFETSSYTLNISDTGACLLLTEVLVSVGQLLELADHESSRKAIVRWVVEGKNHDMMFAGVEFTSNETTSPTHEVSDAQSIKQPSVASEFNS